MSETRNQTTVPDEPWAGREQAVRWVWSDSVVRPSGIEDQLAVFFCAQESIQHAR